MKSIMILRMDRFHWYQWGMSSFLGFFEWYVTKPFQMGRWGTWLLDISPCHLAATYSPIQTCAVARLRWLESWLGQHGNLWQLDQLDPKHTLATVGKIALNSVENGRGWQEGSSEARRGASFVGKGGTGRGSGLGGVGTVVAAHTIFEPCPLLARLPYYRLLGFAPAKLLAWIQEAP